MVKIYEFCYISRATLITKHITMFYKILENKIEMECFWGNFDNVSKLQDLPKSQQRITKFY
jgi:hypothetical protein